MGIAVTDSLKILASGLENFTYSNNDLTLCVNKVIALCEYYSNDLDTIVIGYPLYPSGDKNERTYLVEKFISMLEEVLPKNIKIVKQDERYSTVSATGSLKAMNLKNSQIKKIKDKMAAVVILSSFLEEQSWKR